MNITEAKEEVKIKKQVTAEEFDDWIATCPVPYDQTDNGLNLTESYEFDLRDVKFKFEEGEDEEEDGEDMPEEVLVKTWDEE